MSYKQSSLLKISRVIIVLVAALTITTVSRGGQHWGLYFQGHTPAYVPNNPDHGYNQTRWRRWAEAWPSDLTVTDVNKTPPVKPAPKKQKEEDDQPPVPPSGPEDLNGPSMAPETDQPRTDLQPIPPEDTRPEPPPGLTRPETTEPTAPTEALPDEAPTEAPANEAIPPATTEEQTPELAPLEEPAAEPAASPAATPSPTPGAPLPVPSTDLDTRPKLPRTAPPLKRRATQPMQARGGSVPSRRPAASEAVFRPEDGPSTRITSRPVPQRYVESEQLPASLEELSEEPPATLGSDEPELFQPGAASRATQPRGHASAVKPATYVMPRNTSAAVIRQPARQEVSSQPVPRSDERYAQPSEIEAVESRALPAAPQRGNPLRDGAGRERDGGVSRENPLRP